jgi:hypothetical protein
MSDPTTPTSADPPDPSADPLLTIVIAFLAPMFLWAGDIALARAAAIETLNAYRISSHRSLFTAAKIIAFELATLCSLSQSMAEDIAVPLALRLRGNAISLDRAADRNRQALENDEKAAAMVASTAHLAEQAAAAVAEARQAVRDARARAQATPAPVPPAPVAPPAPALQRHAPAAQPAPTLLVCASAAQPTPAPRAQAPATDQQWNTAWADAMAEVAAEFTAGLPGLPPAPPS